MDRPTQQQPPTQPLPDPTEPRAAATVPASPVHYRRRLGLLRPQGPTLELSQLDPINDCERIAHLLTSYEFPWDIERALELALFYTYGSASVARLLDATGEFRNRGQKRYDDTQLLIAWFVQHGYSSPLGQRAIARMGELHGRFRIPNDDFLFVLWTFIDFPIRWCQDYAWRPFTALERLGWFTFWQQVGERMGLTAIPSTYTDFETWVQRYATQEMVPNEPSRRVAAATVAILAGWLPAALRGAVQPAVNTLIPAELRRALQYQPPSWALTRFIRTTLKVRGRLERHVPLQRYPSLIERGSGSRTYGPQVMPPEALGSDR